MSTINSGFFTARLKVGIKDSKTVAVFRSMEWFGCKFKC